MLYINLYSSLLARKTGKKHGNGIDKNNYIHVIQIPRSKINENLNVLFYYIYLKADIANTHKYFPYSDVFVVILP